jgi:DNA-binding PadR family transcriptional regulator
MKPAEFHILLVLAGEDLHGLGIAQAIDDATDGATRLGPGTLYRTLKQLVTTASIEEAPARNADDDPRRRYYRITDAGRERVRSEAERLARIVRAARDNAVLPEIS